MTILHSELFPLEELHLTKSSHNTLLPCRPTHKAALEKDFVVKENFLKKGILNQQLKHKHFCGPRRHFTAFLPLLPQLRTSTCAPLPQLTGILNRTLTAKRPICKQEIPHSNTTLQYLIQNVDCIYVENKKCVFQRIKKPK